MAKKNKKSHTQILVVDGDRSFLNLSINILKNLGYSDVQTVSDGYVALGKLITSETPFDIIIYDLDMKGVDGMEFMRHAQESFFEGSMILLSNAEQRIVNTVVDLAKARHLDFLGILRKPLNSDLLEQLLCQYDPTKERKVYASQLPISEEELKTSLEGLQVDELVLHYQPKVSVKTGEIVGVEALARWQHNDRGILGPGAFLPLAEKTGLISELSCDIYRKAIRQTAKWHVEGKKIKTSVNFSINTFTQPEFSDFIINSAHEENINPEQIVLEVAETQVVENILDSTEAMTRLRLKKFGLSIDKFGIGNSSMTQLISIPFTELKIDRAIVYDAVKNSYARILLETCVDLAKKLNVEIVAEGAESREDWNLVEELGCDYVQGYYCAKPMPAHAFSEFYENWNGPH